MNRTIFIEKKLKLLVFVRCIKRGMLIATCMATLCGCTDTKTQKAENQNADDTLKKIVFALPEIPSMLTTPEQRSEYLVLHYWDNFNFSDTSLINNPEITEQALTNYINLFPNTSFTTVEKSLSKMIQKALAGSEVSLNHFIQLYEKYLYDPNSPFRNEEYYIATLNAILNNDSIDEAIKVRPQFQLEIALKNRVGHIAADFEFQSPKGAKSRLRKIKAPYIILFFNNPDCHDCARVKDILTQHSIEGVKIVAIYMDEDIKLWQHTLYPKEWINGYAPILRSKQLYDLKAIPTLYLLDSKQQVILKDALVESIIQYINNNPIKKID